MEQRRGILFLADPLCAAALPQQHTENPEERLIFSENEPLLPQAQEALWRVRRRCGWVCVAASGGAVGVALALAAQLPVDRVALAGGRLLAPDAVPRPRSLARIDRYARRNLALVASEVLILDADAEEIAGFARLFARRQLCALETGAPRESPWQRCAPLLCAPWEAVNEKNLLIPGKCV